MMDKSESNWKRKSGSFCPSFWDSEYQVVWFIFTELPVPSTGRYTYKALKKEDLLKTKEGSALFMTITWSPLTLCANDYTCVLRNEIIMLQCGVSHNFNNSTIKFIWNKP